MEFCTLAAPQRPADGSMRQPRRVRAEFAVGIGAVPARGRELVLEACKVSCAVLCSFCVQYEHPWFFSRREESFRIWQFFLILTMWQVDMNVRMWVRHSCTVSVYSITVRSVPGAHCIPSRYLLEVITTHHSPLRCPLHVLDPNPPLLSSQVSIAWIPSPIASLIRCNQISFPRSLRLSVALSYLPIVFNPSFLSRLKYFLYLL